MCVATVTLIGYGAVVLLLVLDSEEKRELRMGLRRILVGLRLSGARKCANLVDLEDCDE